MVRGSESTWNEPTCTCREYAISTQESTSWYLNQKASCCGVTVLTTTPLSNPILRSDLLSCTCREIHKISPPHLTHPGWPAEHTHAHGYTLMETDAIYWSYGQSFTAPGALLKPRPWQGSGLPPLQLSVHQSFEWPE